MIIRRLFSFQHLQFVCQLMRTSFSRFGYAIGGKQTQQWFSSAQNGKQYVKVIPMLAVVHAAVPKHERKKPVMKADTFLLDKADELYNENKYKETYEFLKVFKDSEDVEVLWRLSRALYNQSKEERDFTKRKDLIEEAFKLINFAIDLDDKHFAVHKWYSIILDLHASYIGMKARINELANVKKHMLRAVELNPEDATTLYMLGTWCYSIADMPWYQRKIASTLFASPPTSSFEEALVYFSQAEEIDPNFYSFNLLMLGKTYLKLENKEKACHYLQLASAYPPRTDEDLQAIKEASELLKNINP